MLYPLLTGFFPSIAFPKQALLHEAGKGISLYDWNFVASFVVVLAFHSAANLFNTYVIMYTPSSFREKRTKKKKKRADSHGMHICLRACMYVRAYGAVQTAIHDLTCTIPVLTKTLLFFFLLLVSCLNHANL